MPAAARRSRVKAVTGKPIKFIGTGEKLDQIGAFPSRPHGLPHPGHGRRADADRKGRSRPLTRKRPRSWSRSCEPTNSPWPTYYDQLVQLKGMGSMQDLLGMMPGMGNREKRPGGRERPWAGSEAIILSMTPYERENPSCLNPQPQAPHRRRFRRQGRGGQPTAQVSSSMMQTADAPDERQRQAQKEEPRLRQHARSLPGMGGMGLPKFVIRLRHGPTGHAR